MPNIERIDVSHNAIHQVDKNTFNSLQNVNLSHNYLTEFHRISKKKLEILDLSYNPVQIKPKLFANAMASDSLGQLFVNGVVFSCDENLLEFLSYFACNELKEFDRYTSALPSNIGNLAENPPNQAVFPRTGDCLALRRPTKPHDPCDSLLRNTLTFCALQAMKKQNKKQLSEYDYEFFWFCFLQCNI